MALKDWKKDNGLEWKNKNSRWITIKKGFKYAKYPYAVLYREKSYSKGEFDSLFYAENLKYAIIYAKSYMRTH